MKKVFQLWIYPAIMLSTSAIILYGIKSGYNQYLATIPVITLTGILILVLEKWMPYEKNWVMYRPLNFWTKWG